MKLDKKYKEFFRKLLEETDNLSAYVDSLYLGDEYTDDDLNHIFGVLKDEGLIVCQYADDRAMVYGITFKGKQYFDEEDENKPRIAVLIDQMDEIENLFDATGGNGVPMVNTIHDVQDFQDWLQEVNLELREIYDHTKDHFIWETLNLFSQKMNGRNDKKMYSELKGKLRAIRRNVDKYYPEEFEKQETIVNGRMKQVNKTPKIFISHSSKDVDYVVQIVNLLDGMGLNQTHVFCSSLPGYGIPIDTNIFDYLRNLFSEHDLHVIFVHSENYYNSPVSLNEMGAAWVLRNDVTSILLPGFGFEKMTGVVNGDSVSIKLDMPELEFKDKLNQLYDKIIKEFELTKKAGIIWEQKRDSFIREVQQISENNKNTVSDEDIKRLTLDSKLLLVYAASEDGRIIKMNMLGSPTQISTAGKQFMADNSQRESARWVEALDNLLENGLIKDAGSKGEVFILTGSGYKKSDKIMNELNIDTSKEPLDELKRLSAKK